MTVVRSSLADKVYEKLLERILAGELPEGGVLTEVGLAEEFRVSRGPVREALRRLSADGLVHSEINRKATVSRFTPEDLRQIYKVRELLEGGAAELAAEHADERRLTAMQRLFEKQTELAKAPVLPKRSLDLDSQFHVLVAEASGNAYLKREIARCARLIRVTQRLGVTGMSQAEAWAEHRAIYEAIRRRDGAGAREAMVKHIHSALGVLMRATTAPTEPASVEPVAAAE